MAKPLDPNALENLKPFINKAVKEKVKNVVLFCRYLTFTLYTEDDIGKPERIRT